MRVLRSEPMRFQKLIGLAKTRAINWIRRFPKLDSRLQLLRREILARGGAYPNWRRVLEMSRPVWESATEASRSGRRRVLVATGTGSHLAAMQMETTLAAALTLRGAQVEILLCDRLLPACQMCEPRFFSSIRRFVEEGPSKSICVQCHGPARKNYAELGLPIHSYSDGLTEANLLFAREAARQVHLAEIENFLIDGVRIGEHAKAGALRFLARADLEGEPDAESILRRYLHAAILTALATRALLRRGRFDVVVFHHGIYVPQGVVGEVCRQEGVRVVNWNPAYRAGCFIFSHEDTYHHTLMSEPVSMWQDIGWSSAREVITRNYLRSRWQGDNDWIHFHQNPILEKEGILREIGCDSRLPIIGCFTNVMWDAQLHYPGNAFANMLEWLLHTVQYFRQRPDLQLVIRVHPAEIRGSVPTRQPVEKELRRAFPEWPANVFVVPAESRISSYVLADLCDSVLIYATKMGVELASAGIPVIVAGEAWVRGKGITSDVDSREEYSEALNQLPLRRRLSDEVAARARKYAYHFFFRRMIPMRIFKRRSGLPPYAFEGELDDLRAGYDAGLDCISDGILNGTPFVFDDADPN